MKRILAIGAVLMISGAGFAQTRPLDGYEILYRMNIFSRNRIIPQADSGSVQIKPGAANAAPEPAPVFIGAIKDDSGMTAILQEFEANGAPRIIRIHPGDTVAWDGSKVNEITMDSIILTGGSGSGTRVPIGYDLRNESMSPNNITSPLGARVWPPGRLPNPRIARESGGRVDRSVNVAAPEKGDPPLPPGSADDLEARMQARRLIQLGAGG